ncbi:MAG: sigma-54 dependent transcriptional regulator [Bacillota bacterium]|nr:sigma-54 dependent transcriptional regulator [Bacillota bacterium]
MHRILVIDDEPNIAWLFRKAFASDCEVISAESGERGLELLKESDVDLVMLDLRLPGMDGIETLGQLREQGIDVPVVIMTAYGEVKSAVRAMKLGAYDYITKPFDMDELKLIVDGALRYFRLSLEVSRLKAELQEKFNLRNIVTVSPRMISVFSVVERVCSSDVSVLIQGESGTGKELVARAIHYGSPRRDKPFVPVNCAALPENLLESELFGHEEGAFTGARKRRPGKFEMADGGTLFLDEVGDLHPSLQPKILRVIEEKVVERLGGNQRVPVDVRVVAATNRDLKKEVQEGRFRQDLYFRLAVIPITIPPLRERPEDIPVLVRHFLKESCQKSRKLVPSVDNEAMRALVSYDWPGNVRELKNAMEQISLLCDKNVVTRMDLPLLFDGLTGRAGYHNAGGPPADADPSESGPAAPSGEGTVAGQIDSRADNEPHDSARMTGRSLKQRKKDLLTNTERDMIEAALRRFGGNRTKAAEYLGISRRSLQMKIKKYQL